MSAITLNASSTSSPKHGLLIALFRTLLGAVLLAAGFSKLNDGWKFAEAIANYQLFPAQVNQLAAVVLPWLEVCAGLMLVLALWQRAAALVSVLIFFAFGVAVVSALGRGLDIQCGCFGTDQAVKLGIQTLALDIACLTTALVVFTKSPRN
jgi:uncharacterized membrane protein YphA (DoxX/SURF4 family)